ncbi:MAG: hypothetical protein J6I31_06780 [Prevotella sp.]|nr:hypothetical protein [Prevotella sp.]
MRPYIIYHMMASLDGRIDCAMTEQIDDTNHYYDALASTDGQAWQRLSMAARRSANPCGSPSRAWKNTTASSG